MEVEEMTEVSSSCISSESDTSAMVQSADDVNIDLNPSSSCKGLVPSKLKSVSTSNSQPAADKNISKSDDNIKNISNDKCSNFRQKLDKNLASTSEEMCNQQVIEKSREDDPSDSRQPCKTDSSVESTATKTEDSLNASDRTLGKKGETLPEVPIAPLVPEDIDRNSTISTVLSISDDSKDQCSGRPSTLIPMEQAECNKTQEISIASDNDPTNNKNLEECEELKKRKPELIPSLDLTVEAASEQCDEHIDSDTGDRMNTPEESLHEVGHGVETRKNEADNPTSPKISKSHVDLPETSYERCNVDESSNQSSEDVACMAHAYLDNENAEDPIDGTSPNENDDPFSFSKPTKSADDTLMEVDEGPGIKIISVQSEEDSSASIMEDSTNNSVKASLPIDDGDQNSNAMEGSSGNTTAEELLEGPVECDTQAEINDHHPIRSSEEIESQQDYEMVIDCFPVKQASKNADQQKSTIQLDDVFEINGTPSTSSNDVKNNEKENSTEGSKSTDLINVATEDEVSAKSIEGKEKSGDAQKNKEQSAIISQDSDSPDQDPTLIGGKPVEEVCIVPDTAPRAASVNVNRSGTVKEIPAKECENSPAPQKGDSESVSNKDRNTDVAENSAGDKGDPNQSSDSSNRKVGIHLVSTSSLVSRSDTPDKPERTDEALDGFSTQDHLLSEAEPDHTCADCGKVTKCKYMVNTETGDIYWCDSICFTKHSNGAPVERVTTPRNTSHNTQPRKRNRTFVHKCGQCSIKVNTKLEKSLSWETMDFCNEECLDKFQRTLGSNCANCKEYVQSASLGKYCVRFGYDMKQFCSAPCLEDFKKGLKVCSYCQKDISSGCEGFLAPVGDKGQFKDFCTQECMGKYEQMSNNSIPPEITHECAVCNDLKPVKVEILLDSKIQKLCSEPCFAAFKFVNKIKADQCDMCKKYYNHDRPENFSVFYDEAPHSFCCKTCMNVYILAKRKIVPCSWCKVKKYNFDMIKKTPSGQAVIMLCSLHCLQLHQAVQLTSTSTSKPTKCEVCSSTSPSQYHLTMSDASVASFCSTNCVVAFQGKFSKTTVGGEKHPYPLGLPRRIAPKKLVPVNASVSEKELSTSNSSPMPVISSVTSLAPASGQVAQVNPVSSQSPAPTSTTIVPVPGSNKGIVTETVKTVYKQQFILRPPAHPEMSNCAIQVKPKTVTKGVSCRPHTCTVATQTDDSVSKPILIPVPVPIYIPTPMPMYSVPYPVPIPIVLPIPVPIFLPTTRNSTKGILKEIKRIQEKIPSDPFEAELLMMAEMAEMVAGEKKGENSNSDSEDGGNDGVDSVVNDAGNAAEPDISPEHVDTNTTFGDDVFQMALKMASDFNEPAVDFESSVDSTPGTQTVSTGPSQAVEPNDESDGNDTETDPLARAGIKRTSGTSSRFSNIYSKRVRKLSSSDQQTAQEVSELKVPMKKEPVEKVDASKCLKFTFGVNAWKSWVSKKNAELKKEKSDCPTKHIKLFKADLVQLPSDELNYYLSIFVKEVRKPNGEEYAPDTLYYLCLGIQQYLIENGRIENIFSDPFYEKFTNYLDEAAKRFPLMQSDAQYLVTRIEEEHLWESKQLGAHSPYVLLNTLMYFNTKHFNLMTVEEHMQLSFSHIMKHWKRNPAVALSTKGLRGTRNVLLRFYPPQAALAANSKKKKVYEQQENEDNSLRCPVKLYEFYLSKCPESVKTRNDVFYLLPERSCVPDSPVWYSTTSLGNGQLQKMLHRIKMVKEIVML